MFLLSGMVIKDTLRGIYVNHTANVSLFAKLLIQRHYGATVSLANRLYFNLVNRMGLVRTLFAVNLTVFVFPALSFHPKVLLF